MKIYILYINIILLLLLLIIPIHAVDLNQNKAHGVIIGQTNACTGSDKVYKVILENGKIIVSCSADISGTSNSGNVSGNGSMGYIPQFSGANTINNSVIFQNTSKLDVTTSINVSSGNDICITSGNCLSTVGNGNASWNQSFANTLYDTINAVGDRVLIGASATQGYIPQWQNGTSINNSIIFQNGTHIGIGIQNATQKLVVGTHSGAKVGIDNNYQILATDGSSAKFGAMVGSLSVFINSNGAAGIVRSFDHSANTSADLTLSGKNIIMTVVSGSNVGIGGNIITSQFNVKNTLSTLIGMVIRGITSQSADLFQIQNSSGSVLFNVNNTGRTFIAGGNATAFATLGGRVFQNFTDQNNSGTTETELYKYVIPANMLAQNGDTLIFNFAGTYLASVSNTRFRMFINNNNTYDSNNINTNSMGGTAYIESKFIRTSSTTAEIETRLKISDNTILYNYTNHYDLEGVDYTATIPINITGATSDAGGATGDVSGRSLIVKWEGGAV